MALVNILPIVHVVIVLFSDSITCLETYIGSLWFTGRIYSICCLGVSIILESEKIVTMWPTNDLIALTRKGSRSVGAQPPLFNKQNVKI